MIAHFTDASRRVATAAPASARELDELIARVRALGEPTILFLERDGKTLALGLGARLVPLSWAESTGGATYHSVGDLSRIGCVQLWCRDQLDEFFADQCVPEALAIEAARAFHATGARPPGVHWEADWG